jgi:hypothetical protein
VVATTQVLMKRRKNRNSDNTIKYIENIVHAYFVSKISTLIGDVVWNSSSKDVRDLLKAGKLVSGREDLEWIVSTSRQYNIRMPAVEDAS